MSHIGGENRQERRDIGAGLICIDKGADRESVAKIVQSWPAPTRPRCKNDDIAQTREGALNVAKSQPRTGGRHEEGGSDWCGEQLSPSSQVDAQSIER